MKAEEMKLLKKGDVITIEWGDRVCEATVLENFPNVSKIYINVNYGWFMKFKTIKHYKDYNFEITRP